MSHNPSTELLESDICTYSRLREFATVLINTESNTGDLEQIERMMNIALETTTNLQHAVAEVADRYGIQWSIVSEHVRCSIGCSNDEELATLWRTCQSGFLISETLTSRSGRRSRSSMVAFNRRWRVSAPLRPMACPLRFFWPFRPADLSAAAIMIRSSTPKDHLTRRGPWRSSTTGGEPAVVMGKQPPTDPSRGSRRAHPGQF